MDELGLFAKALGKNREQFVSALADAFLGHGYERLKEFGIHKVQNIEDVQTQFRQLYSRLIKRKNGKLF